MQELEQDNMFENVLFQKSTSLLAQDLKNERLPGSILFYGPEGSGKFTTALELSRVLSCNGKIKGDWNCTCSSCLKHKALVSQNLLITGTSNRTLEIAAAKDTFLNQYYNNTRHLEASRYLFLRSVRKLTARFAPVLWEGEDKLSKFSPVMADIDEKLELLNPGTKLPEAKELTALLDNIQSNCEKLESSFLYDSLPVSQIRNFSSWAHLSSDSGKKVLIIENADKMQDSARNALLKILEEPPEDVIFILTTAHRTSILPTILSRVRTYSFFQRSLEQQKNVIDRIFHYTGAFGKTDFPTITDFLQSYLPVQKEVIYGNAKKYFHDIAEGKVPECESVVKSCGNFSPKVLFRLFLEGIIEEQKKLTSFAAGSESSFLALREIQNCWNNFSVYNQNGQSALEMLARNLMQINHNHCGVFREVTK